MSDQQGYKTIFKSTALFGFVQVFNILTRVGLNKVAALLLGPEGIGAMGLLHNSVNLLKTACGLGVSESAVRDVAESNADENSERVTYICSLVRKIVVYTGLLGVIVTIALSPLLSRWSFNSSAYTPWYIMISLAVGLQIVSDGQLAVLKGLRKLRWMAKASMIGSAAGLISGIPLFYFFGDNGIAPSFIVVAAAAFISSSYYIYKLKFKRIKIAIKQAVSQSAQMIKMGVALMTVTFVGLLFSLVLSSYIAHRGGLADVGLFQAGSLIITGYFSVILTAMRTDYYPRISAIHNDNKALTDELNRQSEAGLVMVFPFAVTFVFLSAQFIRLLYDKGFEASNQFTDIAFIGTIITVVSNCLAMILLAKQAAKIFLWSVIGQRAVLIVVYILLYNAYGLTGLGYGYIFLGVMHISLMAFIMRHNYGITIGLRTIWLLLLVIGSVILTIFVREIPSAILKYSLGTIFILSSVIFSHRYSRKHFGIDFLAFAKRKIKGTK